MRNKTVACNRKFLPNHLRPSDRPANAIAHASGSSRRRRSRYNPPAPFPIAGHLGAGYKLDFGALFYLNRPVPASAQNGAIAFTTTQWSVVLNAQGESPSAQEALEKLCRTYWWPLYGFVRRQGYSPEEAQD